MSDLTSFGISAGTLILILIPIVLLELGLMIWALVDILHRENVRGNNKIVWILVIVLIDIIGPIIYFLAGRNEGTKDKYEE
ncbi:MAG: PLDc N-terminal domain-containing protein [Dehalococcoidia bacterium]|nr:PLDc N-terminal domain-containing protein [Dehalococcoidia bacterium]